MYCAHFKSEYTYILGKWVFLFMQCTLPTYTYVMTHDKYKRNFSFSLLYFFYLHQHKYNNFLHHYTYILYNIEKKKEFKNLLYLIGVFQKLLLAFFFCK